MSKIRDITEEEQADQAAGIKFWNLIAKITWLGPVEPVGEDKKVQSAIIEDETGQIKLKLWNDQTNKYGIGDKIMITAGKSGAFEDKTFITPGLFGKIHKVPTEKPK